VFSWWISSTDKRFKLGWSWEKCVKPIAKTNSCQAPHTQYISGRMKVVMDDGTEG